MGTFKSEAGSEQSNQFWEAIQNNLPIPKPQSTFAFNKLTAMLKGSGINVKKEGSDYTLMPMLDKDVEDISSGEMVELTTTMDPVDTSNTLLVVY